jgi:UDP-3-O-[3-hydroxymyristoyl] glucosamine N-acyltransferase
MFTGRTILLSEIAMGTSANVVRDASIANVGKIPTRLPSRLVYVGSEKYLNNLEAEEGIAAVIVPPTLVDAVPATYGVATAENPHVAAIEVFEALIALPNFLWEDFPTRIAATAEVHPRAIIAEKNVVIGERTVIDAGTVIRERTLIGDDCYVGPVSVLGAEAFDMAPGILPQRLMKQAGGVRLANNATVLSATMVARATFGGFTEIREGACIDNLVQVAHDVDIGRNVSVVGCTKISGRVSIGDNCYIGPNATISNGLSIGANSTVSLGSVVVRDVPDNVRVTGNFAVPHERWIRLVKTVARGME